MHDPESLIYPMPNRNLTAKEHRELVRLYHIYKNIKFIAHKVKYLCHYAIDNSLHEARSLMFKTLRSNSTLEGMLIDLNWHQYNYFNTIYHPANNKHIRLIWLRRLIQFRHNA